MRKHWLLSAAFLLLLAIPAVAQRITASIRGTVTDQTGAVMAGAKVTVKNEATGVTQSAVTNSAATTRSRSCPSAATASRWKSAGFKSEARSKIVLNVADVREVDVQLQTGQISEVVEVEVAAVAVKTVGAEIAGLVTRRTGARAAAERPQLPAAHAAPAGRHGAAGPQHQGQGPRRRLGRLGQRRPDHRQPVARGRREQQRRRLQPHHPRLPLGRRHRGVQGPAQQLRRRVRRGRRRPDQPGDPRRHQRVPRQRATTTPAATS